MPFPATYAQTPANLQHQLDEQTQLQQQLADIENQIAQYQQQLTGIQSQKNTLANKIKQLKAKRAQLTLQIKETTLNIQNIQGQIGQTQSEIDKNNQKLSALKIQMSSIIQNINEQDQLSLAAILLSEDGFSGFFAQLHNNEALNQSLAAVVEQVKQSTAALAQQEQQLADQKQQQENFVTIINVQSGQLAQNLADQNDLLAQTKGQESVYQAQISNSQQQANAIRSRIYQLLGISAQITFGEAVKVAQWASGQSGVRPAFLLAILTQESNLGKNVGTCNRPGDPPSKSWKVVMKPDRDQQPFLKITADLGINPDITPVSCPMRDSKGNQIGWGGAMGPAQFIPSTWMGYKDQVAAITGKAANPWDIRDAFLAAAIKLAGGGATSQSGEWAAAMRYFSGGTNTKYRFYGDSVVATAAQYQQDIDALNK